MYAVALVLIHINLALLYLSNFHLILQSGRRQILQNT
jgi:hypothetical protein